jgi:hypothetical protein
MLAESLACGFGRAGLMIKAAGAGFGANSHQSSRGLMATKL